MVLARLRRAGAKARCRYDARGTSLPSARCLRVLATIGLSLLVLSFVVDTVDPLEILINCRLRMYNGSFLYDVWRSPPVEVFLKVYIFNITNPGEFLAGKEKMRVEEVGPFVYRETLEHVNVTFHDNGTMTHTPRRRVAYIPERSRFDPRTTKLVVPNLAFLGLSSSMHSSNRLAKLALSTLSTYLDAKPLLQLSAHEYLWGYDDPLVHLASKIFPKWINFPRIGVLDRMFDEGDNVVTMRSQDAEQTSVTPKSDLEVRARRVFSIDTYNGSPGLDHWGFGEPGSEKEAVCNTVRGSTEGVVFPPSLRPDMHFSVYRKAFCRTLPLRFVRSGLTPTPNRLPAFWYSLSDGAFERAEDNPENKCYCRPEVAPCLPKGLSDLTPCYYGIPAAVSRPHFLQSDPSLLLQIDGLHPNESLHGTSLAVQPRLGVPLMANIRMQTNLVIYPTRGVVRTQKFSNMTLPIFWIDMTMEGLPPWMESLVYTLLVIAPAVLAAILAAMTAIGAALLMLTAALALLGVLGVSGRRVHSIRPPTTTSLQSMAAAAPAVGGKTEPLLPRPLTPPLLHEGRGRD